MRLEKIFLSDPFLFNGETSKLFIESCRKNAQIHYDGCEFFKFLWNKNQIHPSEIKAEDDLERMPYILVNLFKTHKFITGNESDIILSLGSSGTSGQKSMIYLNQKSLDNVKKLAYNIHESLGITSSKKYNYLCFTYDPKVANDLGTAFTDELLTSFTDKAEVFYTFQHNGKDFYYNEEATVLKLREFEKSSYSTRILGFPAFLYSLIKKYNLKLNLGEDSWVQTGGGWKGDADKEIPKNEFRKIVSESLGVPEKNIRDLFGMVEHGIPYVDDEFGKLRIPNYARVFIRDPYSLKRLPDGEIGLMQFVCSYNTSFPAMSLLTTDYGRILQDEFGPYLEIKARAGIRKNKGCALKALELLS